MIVLLILDQESGKIAIIFENNSLKVMIVELRKTAVKRKKQQHQDRKFWWNLKERRCLIYSQHCDDLTLKLGVSLEFA